MSELLTVKDLSVKVNGRFLVEKVNFSLKKGASLGILGESGSGKSMTLKAIMGLLPPHFEVSGQICFRGKDVLAMQPGERRKLRGRSIGFIVQNPMTAFDPLTSVGGQMVETFLAHLDLSKKEARKKSAATLDQMMVRHPERVMAQYPHELSGGMLQRVMIGLTLGLSPKFIIADEPTTALDVITQYEVLKLFTDIKKLGATIILVSHDLGVIAKVADDLLVMDQGRVVEAGKLKTIFANPAAECTRYLFGARLAMMQRFHRELSGGPVR